MNRELKDQGHEMKEKGETHSLLHPQIQTHGWQQVCKIVLALWVDKEWKGEKQGWKK